MLQTTLGEFEANAVLLATGPFQRPVIPACSADLPLNLLQLDAGIYRNPTQLPLGAVLLVGSGSSGCQIAEELNQAGRIVYLSVGRHRRMPHRHRGQLMLEWLWQTGDFNLSIDSMPGGIIPPPLLLSGVDGGHGIDLRRFAAKGVRLLGRLIGAADGRAFFAEDVEDRLREADASARQLTDRVEAYLALRSGEAAVASEGSVGGNARITSQAILDFRECGITSIIWCTGYGFAFEWVHMPVLDKDGRPIQHRGITAVPGVYFVGLHWMHTFSSGTLFGVGSDAEFVVNHIVRNRQRRSP